MRTAIPSDVETQLLHLSRRRCCLCFGLLGDFGIKKGQIAHLDQDATNNNLANLAFLCLEHHDEYDSKPRQSKGLKLREVLIHRESLYAAVRQFLAPGTAGRAEGTSEGGSPLSSTGELEYYLASSASTKAAGVLVLSRIRVGNKAVLEGLSVANAEALDEVHRGVASRAGLRRYNTRLASTLAGFARILDREAEELALTTTRMLDALSRASSVASDIVLAEPAMFQQKINELHDFRSALAGTGKGALEICKAVRAVPRGTTELNRGRRLAIAALEAFAEAVERQLGEVDRHESHLKKIIALF